MVRGIRSRMGMGMGLAKTQAMLSASDQLSSATHFSPDECKSLLVLYENLNANASGRVDRLRFREFLTCCFDITDDVMLDLTFRAFDRNSDGLVDEVEFIKGLSVSLRGDLEQLIEFAYFAYDMNGDRSLAREELYQCLKGCMIAGYGVDGDELEDAEKDIVEIAMKKLDTNRDGQITYEDFQMAVRQDPLLLQSCGSCLPTPNSMATFLATMSVDYRAYTFQGQGYVPVRLAKYTPSRQNKSVRPSTVYF